MAPRKPGRAPLIRSHREVDVKGKLLDDLSLAHQEALEAVLGAKTSSDIGASAPDPSLGRL